VKLPRTPLLFIDFCKLALVLPLADSGLIPLYPLYWRFNVTQDQGLCPEWPEWNAALCVRAHQIIH
jgi:hypothetical protein